MSITGPRISFAKSTASHGFAIATSGTWYAAALSSGLKDVPHPLKAALPKASPFLLQCAEAANNFEKKDDRLILRRRLAAGR
jgi:hypothetical protein